MMTAAGGRRMRRCGEARDMFDCEGQPALHPPIRSCCYLACLQCRKRNLHNAAACERPFKSSQEEYGGLHRRVPARCCLRPGSSRRAGRLRVTQGQVLWRKRRAHQEPSQMKR